ncbi:hypothetical protein A2U01_0019137 [Trifolium medium]|uniref:Uncharacterized protein n=1 Tax=Trifolium medium TaxID=97028 RepID=A0A392NGC3_9FABA|nr:hypothetical protein [Trifolium medium]
MIKRRLVRGRTRRLIPLGLLLPQAFMCYSRGLQQMILSFLLQSGTSRCSLERPSRAALIAKFFESESMQLKAAKSSFDNAVAKIKVLNHGVELATYGLDELKEVRDGMFVSHFP